MDHGQTEDEMSERINERIFYNGWDARTYWEIKIRQGYNATLEHTARAGRWVVRF